MIDIFKMASTNFHRTDLPSKKIFQSLVFENEITFQNFFTYFTSSLNIAIARAFSGHVSI